MQLFKQLQSQSIEWRNQGYPSKFSVIKEILEFNKDQKNQLKFLRTAQFEALEVYWFLRLKLETPKFLELYKKI